MLTDDKLRDSDIKTTSLPRLRILINEPREVYIECPNDGDPDEILDEFLERLERGLNHSLSLTVASRK